MAAIRFKWTARRDDFGDYYVDETIGEKSHPITKGPMSADAAIRWIDDRAGELQRKFEQLKGEMSGENSATAHLAHRIGGEI